jgi:hypothetical protein
MPARREQNYNNHTHQPIATGVGSLFLIVALVGFALRWFEIGGRASFAVGLLGLVMTISTLLVISRTYVTRLQDRIIKLEMRVRTTPFLSPAQQRSLFSLTNKQIAALRFASDEELPSLIERTERDRLTPDAIKREIRNWVADYDRT